METSISKLAGGQFELTGMNVAGFMSVKENQAKAIDLVSLLLDKEIAKKVRKMGEGYKIKFNIASVLSDLVVTATGQMTRSDIEKILEAKQNELIELFVASKGQTMENYNLLSDEKQDKISAAISASLDRSLAAICAKASNTVGKLAASKEDLELVGSLSDLPGVLQAKIAECLAGLDSIEDLF